MIDNKSFRVTNEQAKEIRDGFFQSLIVGREYDGERGCVTTQAGSVAADLLDARELNDKQEEIIKEMREQLCAVVSTASTPTTKGELVYINNYIEMRAILEKTKEYAE